LKKHKQTFEEWVAANRTSDESAPILTFAKCLKMAREDLGFQSAAEFAQHAGLPYATYAAWENGTRAPNMRNVEQLCRLLRCDVSRLLPEVG
jgi:DNA-binding XRE family transcriptional regulator